MEKKIVRIDPEQLKKMIGNDCACYVLITCSTPSSDGRMEVEMSFEGDEDLAAYLVQNAAQVFDAQTPARESK